MDMKEVNNLSSFTTAMAVFKPSMVSLQQNHRAYKFQCPVDVMFHKSVHPAVITQQAVTLT